VRDGRVGALHAAAVLDQQRARRTGADGQVPGIDPGGPRAAHRDRAGARGAPPGTPADPAQGVLDARTVGDVEASGTAVADDQLAVHDPGRIGAGHAGIATRPGFLPKVGVAGTVHGPAGFDDQRAGAVPADDEVARGRPVRQQRVRIADGERALRARFQAEHDGAGRQAAATVDVEYSAARVADDQFAADRPFRTGAPDRHRSRAGSAVADAEAGRFQRATEQFQVAGAFGADGQVAEDVPGRAGAQQRHAAPAAVVADDRAGGAGDRAAVGDDEAGQALVADDEGPGRVPCGAGAGHDVAAPTAGAVAQHGERAGQLAAVAHPHRTRAEVARD